jgi:hypothetical protein
MQGNNARKSFQVHGPFASGKPGEHVYPTEKKAASAARKLDAHLPKPGTAEHAFHVKMNGSVPNHVVKPALASKSTRLLSIDEAYDALIKDQAGVAAYHADAAKRKAPDASRTAHVDRPPPAVPDVATRGQSEKRKFPRKMKPTIQMKPISNEEAAAHLASGAYSAAKQKSLRWLGVLKALATSKKPKAKMPKTVPAHDGTMVSAKRPLMPRLDVKTSKSLADQLAALKALATGYGKTAGGGALKGANRGGSMPLLGPSGRAAGTSGGHYRKRSLSGKVNFGPDGRHGGRAKAAKFGKLRRAMEAMSSPVGSAKPPKVYLPGVHNPKSPVRKPVGISKPRMAKPPSLGKGNAPLVISGKAPRAVADGGAASELSNSLSNVVIKSRGDQNQMANQTDFNDLFKSELAADHLVDCPHCEAPITKSDLAKAQGHKGKGKTTHQSGPKNGKSGAHVVAQNPEGGSMRGGDGRGVHTSSRPGAGVPKDDPAVGVQNGKGSRTRKGGNNDDDSANDDDDDGDDVGKSAGAETSAPEPVPVKKSIIVRGTPFVQYVDDGSDAAIAKSIAEGTLGGTSPTRPLDLNNDLTRLLI